MLLSTGDIGPPCGVPSSVEMSAASTIAPALSHFPISLRIAGSAIRWATILRNHALASVSAGDVSRKSAFICFAASPCAQLSCALSTTSESYLLATHGRRLGSWPHGLWRAAEPVHLEQVQCWNGIVVPIQA